MDVFAVREKTGEFYLFFGQYPSREGEHWKTKNLLECVRLRECDIPECLKDMTWRDFPRKVEFFNPVWKRLLPVNEYEYLKEKAQEVVNLKYNINKYKKALDEYNSLPWWKKLFVKEIKL